MSRDSLADYFDLFYRHARYVACVHRRGYRMERWTYGRIADAASQMARELESRGIAKGDRVVLWGENCAEWLVAFWGCVLCGVVVVPMDRIAAGDFAARVADQVDAKLAVGSRELLATLRIPCLPFEEQGAVLARHPSAHYGPPALGRSDTLQIIFTSGTTADPKGVVISHGNVLANLNPIASEIERYRLYGRPFRPIRFLDLLPLSHVFGQFLGVLVPPLLPGTVLFQESLNPAEVIRTIQRERVSVLVAVPRLLESLRQKLERDAEAEGRLEEFRRQVAAPIKGHFLKRWWRFRKIHRRFGWKFWALICGGAALDADTEEFWRRLGYAVIQGYGMTETTSLVSVNHPFKMSHGSIGRPLPGREIKLDESGEILVRGESIAAGYWQDHQMRPVPGDEGWLRTGDIGALDADGNLFFKGRKKEVIVTPEGMNIYPEDLEAALRRQPEVRDCAVVGLDREGNAVPCAALLLHDGADAEAVVRRANQSLAEFQQMRHWLLWPEEDFPRTSTHKARTNLIAQVAVSHFAQATASAAQGAGAATAVTTGSLSELIARIARRSPAELSPDASLAQDLNLSSLERVELMSAIEDRYQVELNEAKFTLATTVRDLEQMLHQPSGESSRFHYPRWPQTALMKILRFIGYYLLAWPATILLAWPRVRGRENLRGVEHPAMFICNHVSWVDFGFVLFALTPHLRRNLAVAMEGERVAYMRSPPAGTPRVTRLLNQLGYWLMTGLFNVFPLPARAGFRESFAFAGDLVDRGFSLAIFPEGMRTRDGQLGPFRTGTGLLVNNLRLPIVPLRIDGLWELKIAGHRRAPWGSVTVTIGKPLRIEPGRDPAQICEELRQIVASL
jgi:long-chain acyl-CoA synthetase